MLNQILAELIDAGGNPLVVGGYVRDKIIGVESKDKDVEVFGLSVSDIIATLGKFGTVDCFGQKFGVVKLFTEKEQYDFSVPRRDSKNGVGHKGFAIEVDHTMTPYEAGLRRDFTINSMAENINGELIDFHGGRADIEAKILRPTSDKFHEDPLRILRGLQFSARFGFSASQELIDIKHECVKEFADIPPSRIWTEWEKWLLKGVHYSTSLDYLCDVLDSVYPEFAALKNVEQDLIWHPEGNVLKHTGHCLDYLAKKNYDGDRRIILMLAVLCHDIGKLTHTTHDVDGRIRARGHEAAGEIPTRKFLEAINCPKYYIERVVGLVIYHMSNTEWPCPPSVRKLAFKLDKYKTSIDYLAEVIEADRSGRPPLPEGRDEKLAAMVHMSAKENCDLEKQPALVTGQQIKDLGYSGPMIGKIQDHLYNMQMKGSFKTADQGLRRIKDFVKWLEEQ